MSRHHQQQQEDTSHVDENKHPSPPISHNDRSTPKVKASRPPVYITTGKYNPPPVMTKRDKSFHDLARRKANGTDTSRVWKVRSVSNKTNS